jgi:hypothetical protein
LRASKSAVASRSAGGQIAAVGGELRERVKGDLPRVGGDRVVRRRVDRGRRDPRLGGKRLEPAGEPLPLGRPHDHVEDHDHGLAGGGRRREELAHGGVVVFLLGQDGDEHVGGVADEFRAMPVFPQRAVDVGCVEHDQPLRLPARLVLPPHEHVAAGGVERVRFALPGNRLEAREQVRQVDPGREPAGQARHRVERAGGFGQRAADLRADQRVGDQALAGVRASADGRHEQGLAGDLGPELAEQGPMPVGAGGVREPEFGRQRFERGHEIAGLGDAAGPGGKRRLRRSLVVRWLHAAHPSEGGRPERPADCRLIVTAIICSQVAADRSVKPAIRDLRSLISRGSSRKSAPGSLPFRCSNGGPSFPA